jgi:hypothetical protein
MQMRLDEVKRTISYGYGAEAPRIAMHVRLGDKLKDQQSQQKGVAGQPSDYFRQADAIVNRIRADECPLASTKRCAAVGVYIATDSGWAAEEAKAWAAGNPAVRLVLAGAVASQNVSAGGVEVAKAIGGRKDAYAIAEEVVVDLNLMLPAQHFVGLCMSQLARYVVAVGFARGTLKEAVAMDRSRIQKKDQFKLGPEFVPWREPYA